MNRTATFALLLAPLCAVAHGASPPRQLDGAQLQRAIERLSVVGSVLYIAAHPDDENTKLLAYLANERLLRTAYLSLTRGDGGQNLIGAEQGPLLGLIRTQELLAARRIDGAEQFFTRARDFGYSKTADETLTVWGKDDVLADVVRVIRTYKPDLIITRFPAKGGDTHGHHTASAIVAEAAFRAAADPSFHPEQVRTLGAWQARRIVWNKSLFNAKPNEDLSPYIQMDIGAYNPVLGTSYGEMAATSRSMHKSQGFGSAPTRGPSPEYFQLREGEPARKSIFDGLDFTWARVPGVEKLAQALRRAREQFRPDAPQAAVPSLLEAYGELERLPENPWKEPKLRELREVIAGCAGLWLEASAGDLAVVPGGEVNVAAVALNRAAPGWTLKEVRFPGGIVAPVNQELAVNHPFQLQKAVPVAPDSELSNPYWLSEPPEKGLFTVRDPALIGLPERPAALRAEFVLVAGGRTLELSRDVHYKWIDPVAGERTRALEVLPAVMVTPGAAVLMFPDERPRELRVVVKAGAARAAGVVRPEPPAGWRVEPPSLPFSLEGKGAEDTLAFQLRPPPGRTVGGSLRVVAEVDGQRLSRGLARIEYPHIPIQTLLPEAEVKLVRFDLKRAKTRIGYIPGAGDEVAAALRQVGYEVTLLGDEPLRNQSAEQLLRRFEAIVVGVRAYNTNGRLPFYHKKLMDYVAGGGTLVTQYNTNNRLSQAPQQIGPNPFEISQERVTDENAAVRFSVPEHAILNKPNRITDSDFAGWVQERGLYFAGKWANEYQPILSMNDPGESPKLGGLLVARHGKGAFIYTGLAFFRQLPAGVPGAFRLFANLIAYGR